MDWRILAVIAATGFGLTIARRMHNEDTGAGAGVAGWTVVMMTLYVIVTFWNQVR